MTSVGPATGSFRLGVEELLATGSPALLRGARVGLLTNPTGTDRALRSTIDLLVAAQERGGFTMTALFGPEHGVRGAAPAGETVADEVDPRSALPVRSLYGAVQRPTEAMLADVDVLVVDLQDIGARFFTYVWTVCGALETAASTGTRVVVLDRPNPLGPRSEGFVLEPGLASLVGAHPVPQTHGLTLGELARLVSGEFLGGAVDLAVVPMAGHDPQRPDAAHLPWVPPSPNIPTRATAAAYAGTGLLEALNVSEGRGTALPFLWCGAPFLTGREIEAILADLRDAHLPGVLWREMHAVPTASKHAGEACAGIQLHLLDTAAHEPVRTGIHLLSALLRHGERVAWRERDAAPVQSLLLGEPRGSDEPGGAGDPGAAEEILWIDRLTGTRRVRTLLEAGEDPQRIVEAWRPEVSRFARTAARYRLY